MRKYLYLKIKTYIINIKSFFNYFYFNFKINYNLINSNFF